MTLGRLLARLHLPDPPRASETPKPRGLLRMFLKTQLRKDKPTARPELPNEGTFSAIIAPYAEDHFHETPVCSPANALLFELDSLPATLDKTLTPEAPPERVLNFSAIPDEIDALSFDDIISHSTSRRQSLAVPGQTTDQDTEVGSIIDASIHVFKHYLLAQRLKYIAASPAIVESPVSPSPQRGELVEMPLLGLQSPSPVSPSPQRGEGVERPFPGPQSPSLMGAKGPEIESCAHVPQVLDEDLDFSQSTSADVFRDELISLVKKHNLMIAKQQEEIRHLKELLVREREYNSLLSSPLLKSVKAFSAAHSLEPSPAESQSTTRKRSRFLPLDIVVFGDDDGQSTRDSDLLPPFAPTTEGDVPGASSAFFSSIEEVSPGPKTVPKNDLSRKHNLAPISVEKIPQEQKTLWAPLPVAAEYCKKNTRNCSVSSAVSSVMSTSHGKAKPAADPVKSGDVDQNNISSSTVYSTSAISTNPHSNLTTPDTIYFQMGLAPKSEQHAAPFFATSQP